MENSIIVKSRRENFRKTLSQIIATPTKKKKSLFRDSFSRDRYSLHVSTRLADFPSFSRHLFPFCAAIALHRHPLPLPFKDFPLHLSLTNSRLFKGNAMMLEADVVLGKVTGQDTVQPIMAHPPANESDLSLENFLNAVIEKKGRKGIKLDFKSIEAFNGSKPILDKVRNNVRIYISSSPTYFTQVSNPSTRFLFFSQLTFPVFLNADILEGPTNATATPVDAKSFVGQAKAYPEYTLSVGWTTK